MDFKLINLILTLNIIIVMLNNTNIIIWNCDANASFFLISQHIDLQAENVF